MPAYIVARMKVTDPEQYAHYQADTPTAVAEFGGRFIVRGGKKETLEGPAEERRIVVLEFESMERAHEFYHSATYQAAKAKRDGAAEGEFLLVDGC